MIVLGCALRVLAFGLFALVTSPIGILAAAVLTGFAGALFTPAVRAYLSREVGAERAGAFAVSTVAGIALYVRVAAWGGRRWPPGTCVAAGLALMSGVGFYRDVSSLQ